MTLCALAILLQGAFQREGPLEFKNIEGPTAPVAQFQTAEIKMELTGTWNNVFDPSQIDVSANIGGPGDISFTAPGFFVLEDGKPFWKIRFSPWAAGNYVVNISALDTLTRIEAKKVNIKASGIATEQKDSAGFIESKEKSNYFFRNNKLAYLYGARIPATDDALNQLNSAGGNFCLIDLDASFGAVESRMGVYDLEKLAKLEAFLNKAKANNIYVLLGLHGRDWLSSNWAKNPYNASNGGPCQRPEDFWTSLQARIAFKKYLRYLVARFSANSALAGVAFFTQTDAPDYWVEEMSMEMYELHPYQVIATSSSNEERVMKAQRVNCAMPLITTGSATAIEMQLYEAIRTANQKIKKPAIADIADKSLDPTTLLWLQMASGAAGAITPAISDYKPFRDFISKSDWSRRRFESRQVGAGNSAIGWALIDTAGGVIYLEAPDALKNANAESVAGTAIIAVKKGGKYRYSWFNVLDGSKAADGEVQESKGEVSIPFPGFKKGLACLLEKL